MKHKGFLLLVVATAFVTLPLACQEPPSSAWGRCFGATEPAQCELKAGVESQKNARYEEAIAHFRRAVSMDSKLLQAHLYLATALAQQYIPGVETHDNAQYAEQAITEYSTVLHLGRQDSSEGLIAVRSIATLYLQMKQFGDAKDYYRKAIEIDPKDPEPYFNIAVIDWTEPYTARMKAYEKLGIKPQERQLDIGACQKLADDYLTEVEEGMQMLVKALELRPDYDDAMAYMNLLYRERADLRCNDAAARNADLAKADKWVDATLAAKKTKAEQPQRSHADTH